MTEQDIFIMLKNECHPDTPPAQLKKIAAGLFKVGYRDLYAIKSCIEQLLHSGVRNTEIGSKSKKDG